ncbi:MAG: SurA N-terminal domain-containing protein [Alphaproteobacteria bacterium]|nr:SurA N-terminal domain-containing protein [Alphaproteobacteria bacterium]
MLEYLRNAAEKPLAKILIGILTFSFVGWGVAEWIFGNVAGNNTLIRVGDSDISVEQFNLQKSHELAKMSREQQREIYSNATKQRAFSDMILQKMAVRRMSENHAKKLGFVVTDTKIATEIRTSPEFQSNGHFSAILFDKLLIDNGYTESSYADAIRNDILSSYVLGALNIDVPVPMFAARAEYNARNAQRQIEYATVKFDDFKVGDPTDDQLRDFYAKNPHVIPEHRAVSYILVPADLSKPDEYDSAYTTAQHVEDDIFAGETMKQAASNNKARYVTIPAFAIDKRPVDKVLTDTIVNKIFAMDEGTESELIETKYGFVIFRVDNVIPAHNAEFADVKNSLIAGWRRDQQRTQAYIRANELLSGLNNGTVLSDKRSVVVTRASGAPVDVLVATFRGKEGANSIVPGSDAFYVLHIAKAVLPIENPAKMDDIRAEMKNMQKREISDDYNSFLNRKYPIKVNTKNYNHLISK